MDEALRHAREAQEILRRVERGYGALIAQLGDGVVADDLDAAREYVGLVVEDLEEALRDAPPAVAPAAAGAAAGVRAHVGGVIL